MGGEGAGGKDFQLRWALARAMSLHGLPDRGPWNDQRINEAPAKSGSALHQDLSDFPLGAAVTVVPT